MRITFEELNAEIELNVYYKEDNSGFKVGLNNLIYGHGDNLREAVIDFKNKFNGTTEEKLQTINVNGVSFEVHKLSDDVYRFYGDAAKEFIYEVIRVMPNVSAVLNKDYHCHCYSLKCIRSGVSSNEIITDVQFTEIEK